MSESLKELDLLQSPVFVTETFTQRARDSGYFETKSWEDLLQCFKSAIMKMFDEFLKVKESLVSLQTGSACGMNFIVDSIKYIREPKNEILKCYFQFYELNNPQGVFGFTDINEYTYVKTYLRKSTWYCEVDMDNFWK
ncbi:hypothetical protein METBIDRAFT_10491 [Metschnikowia bicuspidata var. bicuspidata NRRL YB-4993]|uniref:Uncharacterized protein n=1 Tax=Metschnikowia bicuspidata var. bicuspidata NRRL YB-4993 TaxID=869754 RepID=A0A1A0HKC8_9ASCO|nr:hypothetical protein METBIDRAFT_10491 [Metschnikowia bicuspidata var. bicuspidata NRRL YB-4993]OBA24342.1 hypothetical protein METBIDRAFT_10491 [Metschnikowia bicuspidata var. bicuspidata NRRL YB-4993]